MSLAWLIVEEGTAISNDNVLYLRAGLINYYLKFNE